MDTCTLTHHHHQLQCTFGLYSFSFLQELLQKYLVDILPSRSPHIRGFLVINPSTASSGVPLCIHASRASPFYSLEAIAGYLDSIVSAKQNSGCFGYSISPNHKLVALGASNVLGSFVPGTLPTFGSIARFVFKVLCPLVPPYNLLQVPYQWRDRCKVTIGFIGDSGHHHSFHILPFACAVLPSEVCTRIHV